jgi:hypothetical protein
MTIYTIDLLKLSSVNKLPSSQTVIEICQSISIDILQSLTNLRRTYNLREYRMIMNHIYVLGQYGNLIGERDSVQTENHCPFSIRYFCIERQIFSGTIIKQYCRLDTLKDVLPSVLIQLLHQALVNGLICAKLSRHSMSEALYGEWREKIRRLSRELLDIFPKLDPSDQYNLVSAKVNLLIEDQKEEVKNCV